MIVRPRHVVITVAPATVVTVAGCNRKSDPRVPVSGTVTLDGKPLPVGFISFVSPREGVFESVDIKDGVFKGKARPGNRQVDISAFREDPRQFRSSRPDAPPPMNYLPERYSGASSKLTADVTEKGPNEFTFELTMGKDK